MKVTFCAIKQIYFYICIYKKRFVQDKELRES